MEASDTGWRQIQLPSDSGKQYLAVAGAVGNDRLLKSCRRRLVNDLKVVVIPGAITAHPNNGSAAVVELGNGVTGG